MENGLLEQGLLYHEQGRYKESLKCFEEAAQSTEHKSNPLVFYMLGICLRENWSDEEVMEKETIQKKESSLKRKQPSKSICLKFTLPPVKPKPKQFTGPNAASRRIQKQNMTRAISCFQRSLDLLMDSLNRFEEANGTDTLSKLRASVSSFKKSELDKDGRWKNPTNDEEENGATGVGSSKNEKCNSRSHSLQKAVKLQKSSSSAHEIAACAKQLISLPVLELGYCNFYGWGVPKNRERALYYFTPAALLGDKDAQYQLGFMYERGLFVKRDFVKASKYYRMYVDEQKKTQEFDLSWIYEPKFASLPIESETEAFSLAMEQLRRSPPDSTLFCNMWPFRPKR